MRFTTLFSCRALRAVAACFAAAMMLTATTARADVISYFSFDDASDPTTAVDDSGNGWFGQFNGPAKYGEPGSGAPGGSGDDRALDLGGYNNDASVTIPGAAEGAFDSLFDTQEATVLFWLWGGDDQPQSNWTYFIGDSDRDGSAGRMLGSHAPWGGGTVYFDATGCCGADSRINKDAPEDLWKGGWNHYAYIKDQGQTSVYINFELFMESAPDVIGDFTPPINLAAIGAGHPTGTANSQSGLMDGFGVWDEALSIDRIEEIAFNGVTPPPAFIINGGGETYFEDFDVMGTGKKLPVGWSGVTNDGSKTRSNGLGLTDGFLTVPGSEDDGVLGVLNLGGNESSFGPATAGHIPTWTAELADTNAANPLFGRDDVIADAATDRALGIGRENNDDLGELNFEIEIAENALRAFVFDWDLEIWGGDPDGDFRSVEGPGMKVDVAVGGNSYDTMTANLLPGTLFDSLEDDGDTIHNATLIDGNVHSVRGMTSGIKEVSGADGAVGNMVQVNFNANWNDATSGPNGWFSAVDNVRFRALAPGDADANGVVDVADLLQLLGGQKFNQGVDGVTWEQGDFNADDQFNTGDLLAMLSFLSGTFPSDPYASEAGGANDAVADIIVNSETGEVTVDLAGHTVSAVIIESASEIFNGSQPAWDTTSQFPSTLPGELGNVLFTSTASGTDELGVVISSEFLGRDKEFYLQDLDLNILIASEGGALTKGNVIVVPEPSTWMLLGLGSLLLVGWRQAKRSPGKN